MEDEEIDVADYLDKMNQAGEVKPRHGPEEDNDEFNRREEIETVYHEFHWHGNLETMADHDLCIVHPESWDSKCRMIPVKATLLHTSNTGPVDFVVKLKGIPVTNHTIMSSTLLSYNMSPGESKHKIHGFVVNRCRTGCNRKQHLLELDPEMVKNMDFDDVSCRGYTEDEIISHMTHVGKIVKIPADSLIVELLENKHGETLEENSGYVKMMEGDREVVYMTPKYAKEGLTMALTKIKDVPFCSPRDVVATLSRKDGHAFSHSGNLGSKPVLGSDGTSSPPLTVHFDVTATLVVKYMIFCPKDQE